MTDKVDAAREPYVLRLTGEQMGSITPAPDGDWFVDWDEYEEFVPRRMYEEATIRAESEERLRADGWHDGYEWETATAMEYGAGLAAARAEYEATVAALRDAAQEALDAFDRHGGFSREEWPEMEPLRAALAATPEAER